MFFIYLTFSFSPMACYYNITASGASLVPTTCHFWHFAQSSITRIETINQCFLPDCGPVFFFSCCPLQALIWWCTCQSEYDSALHHQVFLHRTRWSSTPLNSAPLFTSWHLLSHQHSALQLHSPLCALMNSLWGCLTATMHLNVHQLCI